MDKGDMVGKNFSFVEFALVSMCLVSPLTAVQPDDPRSHEAAAILDQAVAHFEKLPDKPSAIRVEIRSRLVATLVANWQFDDAESVVGDADDMAAKQLLAFIGESRVVNLSNSVGSGRLSADDQRKNVDAIGRLSKKSGEYPISRYGESIDKLLEHNEVELATRIIASSHGDMNHFKVELGSWGNPHYKMSNLAKVAEYYLRRGNVRSADKVFNQFGQALTREQARLYVLEHCLIAGQEDVGVAESMLIHVDSGGKKFRGAFRLATYFVHQRNLVKSIEYAEMMDEYPAERNLGPHSFQARLMVNIAQLELSEGNNADQWKQRAKDLAGDDEFVRMYLICVCALHGDFEPVEESPAVAMDSLMLMLNFRNGSGDLLSPFRLIDAERLTSCAFEIAERFDNPYLRAHALCAVAAKVAKTDKVKSKQIVLSALEAAKEPAVTRSSRPVSEFDQGSALQRVANQFAQIGEFKQAVETIDLMPKEPALRFQTDVVSQYGRESALLQMIGHLDHEDAMFSQQNAPELFALVDELEKPDSQNFASILTALTGKLVESGNWSSAERLYEQGIESGHTLVLPYQVVYKIASTQDHEKLQRWFDLCEDGHKIGFLHTFCHYFNVRSLVPASRTVVEVEAMWKEISRDQTSSSFSVDKFLIVGLWTDGFEERARAMIDQIEPQNLPIGRVNSRESMLRELAKQADQSDLPELAMLLAKELDPSGIPRYLFNGANGYRSYDRSNKLVQDNQWLDRQKAWVQVALLLRRASEIMLQTGVTPKG